MPLPVGRMDPHLRGARADAVDEREGLQSGQRGRRGVLRQAQAGVLPQAKLPRCLDRRVHHVVGRVHGLVQGQAHQTRIRDEHHGQTHPARARRLNVRAIVANDHSDNEVQQNVTAPNGPQKFDKTHGPRGRTPRRPFPRGRARICVTVPVCGLRPRNAR